MLYQKGLPFYDKNGKMRPGKIMGASCAPTCRYSCAEKVNDEKRKEIFDKFLEPERYGKTTFYLKP